MNILRILVPLAAVGVAIGCGPAGAEGSREASATVAAPTNAARVEVAVLRPSEAALELSLPGEIEGSHDATLASSLGGYVESVAVEPGQTVRKGQVLARIDSAIHAAALAQAEAQRDLAQADLGRIEKMGDLATPQQRENAAIQVRVAQAGVDQARARLSRAVITAPFAGTVAQVAVDPGEVANPGTPVVRLVALDPVVVSMAVTDRDMVALAEDMDVEVTTSARAGLFTGKVTHISAAAHPSTRAFEVEASVANSDGALLPGMIARVRATRSLGGDQLVIPQDWVVTRLDGQGVFVDDGGVAAWRPIRLGQVVRDQVVVEDGVSEGDRVVITGHRELVEGDRLIVSREGTCCTAGRAVFAGG